MEINIKINLDNAAFTDDTGDDETLSVRELGRVFDKITDAIGDQLRDRLEADGDHGNCFDTNGNKVGTWEIS